jgi:hypothetical protein
LLAVSYTFVVRYFLRRHIPEPSRILLVESGSRRITEILIPRVRAQFGASIPIDVVTCVPAAPAGVTDIYNVNEYRGWRSRLALARELRARGYGIAGIVCSAEPMLNKWKWGVVAVLPAKLMIANENADWFWLDRAHWPHIRRFVKHRAGLADAGIVRAAARLAIFPLTLSYLLLYAAAAHFRRALYRGFR